MSCPERVACEKIILFDEKHKRWVNEWQKQPTLNDASKSLLSAAREKVSPLYSTFAPLHWKRPLTFIYYLLKVISSQGEVQPEVNKMEIFQCRGGGG